MEIHLIYLLYFTALSFTVISYYAKNNLSFSVIAAVGWIAFAMSTAEISYIGFDNTGTGHIYQIQMGDPYTSGMIGSYYFYWGIGIVILLMTGGWMLLGREVGDEV